MVVDDVTTWPGGLLPGGPLLFHKVRSRHVRAMIEVGEGPAANVAKETGMHPFRAEKLVRQATAFPPPALAQAYREIAAADRRTKAGEESEELALERAVVAVTALRGAETKAARRG